jgi:predicted lysophospholipase L1 biosynthesis ABC-type transport system permease subunit
MLAGRDFSAFDLNASSPPVAVVNETLARQVFGNGNAVGQQFRMGGRLREVIGVVRDSRYTNLRGALPPIAYQPFLQTDTGRGQMALYVRVAGGLAPVLPHIREAVRSIDNEMPLFEVRTLAEEVDAVLTRERLIAAVSSFFGVLALVLACVGLYGLLAFAVIRRTAEMGIHMALGAKRSNVVWTVMREGLLLVLAGVAIGVPAAIATGQLASSQISSLLFGLRSTDPLTMAAAAGLLILVAAAASYFPARRASRIDPMAALRND